MCTQNICPLRCGVIRNVVFLCESVTWADWLCTGTPLPPPPPPVPSSAQKLPAVFNYVIRLGALGKEGICRVCLPGNLGFPTLKIREQAANVLPEGLSQSDSRTSGLSERPADVFRAPPPRLSLLPQWGVSGAAAGEDRLLTLLASPICRLINPLAPRPHAPSAHLSPPTKGPGALQTSASLL